MITPRHIEEYRNAEPHPQDIDEAEPTGAESFDELADRWEKNTVLLSNPSRAAQHPAHREIVSMSEVAIPRFWKECRRRAETGSKRSATSPAPTR